MLKISTFRIVVIFLIITTLIVLTVPCLRAGMLRFKEILFFQMEYTEIVRLQSPDGKLDAVLMQGSAGAMDSFHYNLYIVQSVCSISSNDVRKNRYTVVLAASSMSGEKIVWLENKVLEIQYREAQIHEFINRVRPLPEDRDYEVEIRKTLLTGTPSSSSTWMKSYIYKKPEIQKEHK